MNTDSETRAFAKDLFLHFGWHPIFCTTQHYIARLRIWAWFVANDTAREFAQSKRQTHSARDLGGVARHKPETLRLAGDHIGDIMLKGPILG